MLAKLKSLREDHENGFTLIELLVVILIIGILSAIAVPVFLNQRKVANDSVVQSDVKNAASATETWVAENGLDRVIDDVVRAEIKAMAGPSADVTVAISGSANSFCVLGAHVNGKKYLPDSPLTYDSLAGGLGKTGGACNGETLPEDGAGTIVSPVPGPVELAGIGTIEAYMEDGKTKVSVVNNTDRYLGYWISEYKCAGESPVTLRQGQNWNEYILFPGANAAQDVKVSSCTLESFVASPDQFSGPEYTIDKAYTVQVRPTK